MSFDKKSFVDIYETMLADTRRRIPELTDFEEGSVIRSLFETFAVELATLYEQLDLVYQAGFIDTAEEAHLDRVVAVLGIKRNEPDFATGSVTFERDKGLNEELVIPIGTLVMTEEDESKDPPKKAYITIEEGRMAPGEAAVEVRIQADERGKKMVADPETIVVMPRPVPGIKAIRNQKPVRFLGRDRESDAELRQRAKQALLASGRASITSIENALFGMPGVREVRVKEDFPADGQIDKKAPGLGMIEVYVDGLTSQNAPALRERIDQARAAGVYVSLKPAIAIHLDAVIEVELDKRISAEERPKTENEVALAVEGLVASLGMGQPLLFSQLASEILKVNGVKDVPKFQITAYCEDDSDRSRACGYVLLTREAIGRAVTIPANAILRTELGGEFLTTNNTVLAEGQATVEVEVRAARSGRGGELLRTGSAIGWEKVKIGGLNFTASNQVPIRIQRDLYGPFAELEERRRRIDAQILERLVAESIRVAAGQKALRVRVQVQLPALTGELEKRRLAMKNAEGQLREAETQGQIIDAANKAIRDADGTIANAELQRQSFDEAVTKINDAAQAIEDAEARQKFINANNKEVEKLRQRIAGIEKIIETAAREVENQRQVLADAEKASEKATKEAEKQRKAVAEADSAIEKAREIAAKQRPAIEEAVRAFFAERKVGESFTKTDLESALEPSAGENFNLRLVSFPFQGQSPQDDYLVEASFVEKPEAEIVFVYHQPLFLSGKINLVLPLTATGEEKRAAEGAARQAVRDFLDALAPEEDVDLEKIQEVVSAVEKVLRIEFRPEDCTLLNEFGDALPDRVKDRAVSVDALEKVFLADSFEIKA